MTRTDTHLDGCADVVSDMPHRRRAANPSAARPRVVPDPGHRSAARAKPASAGAGELRGHHCGAAAGDHGMCRALPGHRQRSDDRGRGQHSARIRAVLGVPVVLGGVTVVVIDRGVGFSWPPTASMRSPPSFLRRADPERDRAGAGHLADARVPASVAHARVATAEPRGVMSRTACSGTKRCRSRRRG